MKFLKQLQIFLFQNIKTILASLIIFSFGSIIFYLEILDFHFFHTKEIIDLKEKVLEIKDDLNQEDLNSEIKDDLNQEIKDDLNQEKTQKKNNNIYYYLIAGTVIVMAGLFLYYYAQNADNDNNNLISEGFADMLAKLSEQSSHEYYLDPDTDRTGPLFAKVINRGLITQRTFYPPSSIASTDTFTIRENRGARLIDLYNPGFADFHP